MSREDEVADCARLLDVTAVGLPLADRRDTRVLLEQAKGVLAHAGLAMPDAYAALVIDHADRVAAPG